MVADQLDAVFGALADPTRRAILTRLTQGEATVAELAAPFRVSQPAISRHLKVLERAGLISRTRRATARLSHLRAEPLREATVWLAGYREYWEAELRAARRAARRPAGAGDRPIAIRRSDRKEHVMSEMQVTAEPGVPQVLTSRELDAPLDARLSRVHRAGAAGAVARAAEVHDDGRPLRPPRRRHVALRPRRRRRQRVGLPRRLPRHSRRPTASCRRSSSRARPATSRWTRSRSRSTTARPRSAPTRCSSRSRPATRWSTPAWPAA